MVESLPKQKTSCHSQSAKTIIIYVVLVLLIALALFIIQTSPFSSSSSFPNSWPFLNQYYKQDLQSELQESNTFLPLKDLAESPFKGNTWFLSSLDDTYEENEAEYLYFPSESSKGRLLCLRGNNTADGTKNHYSLARPDSLPDPAIVLRGLTFLSNTYYDYTNLWHGLCALAPFVRWSLRNECVKPTRWVLFHWGELRTETGSWLKLLMEANYGQVAIQKLENSEISFCFERVVVMRHEMGFMGVENRHGVFDQLRCNARKFCGVNPIKEREVNVRLTLLMRKGARGFKDPEAVTEIFRRECERVEGCVLNVAQSEELSFCEQVEVMSYTDVVASPHGAQLTNMMFMDLGSSVMEFFPKGWLELAGNGQNVYRWMADHSGMKHRGSWWDKLEKKECGHPEDQLKCFDFYKNGRVGHNETYFAGWVRNVLTEVKSIKQLGSNAPNFTGCPCQLGSTL